MSKNERKHPKGYWMGVGISVGVAIGVALGPIFDNLGVGIGIGIALGSGIGASLEQRNKDNLRPLTEQERTRQKRSIATGLALTTILAVFLIIVYFLQAR
jgi:drug/metabolite transporter (DMT)-like permease